MLQVLMVKEVFFLAIIYELICTCLSCTYVVESRRVIERAIDLREQKLPSGSCEIPGPMKDRWELVDRPRERMRIRGDAMVVKYGNTRIKYNCMENKGHTFLLATSKYLGNRQGVLCLGFAQINNNDMADYSVIRLNGHGFEHHLLSPQLLPVYMNSFPTLNETCVLTENNRENYAYIRRSERRCMLPNELLRTWNTTYHSARAVSFGRKTFTMLLMNGTKYKFDCSVKDGDLYVFRSKDFTDPVVDGIICFNITKLVEDPHYKYEMSRLNSGEHLEGMVKLFPTYKPINLRQHCDWIESPARPEFIY